MAATKKTIAATTVGTGADTGDVALAGATKNG